MYKNKNLNVIETESWKNFDKFWHVVHKSYKCFCIILYLSIYIPIYIYIYSCVSMSCLQPFKLNFTFIIFACLRLKSLISSSMWQHA